jgi:hypothetical protein
MMVVVMMMMRVMVVMIFHNETGGLQNVARHFENLATIRLANRVLRNPTQAPLSKSLTTISLHNTLLAMFTRAHF